MRVLHGRAALVDVSAAAVLSAGAVAWLPLGDNPGTATAAVVCALAATTSVGWRGRAPEAAVVVAGAGLAGCAWTAPAGALLAEAIALLLTFYTAAARGSSRRQVGQLIALAGYGIAVCAVVAAAGSFSVSAVAVHALPVVAAPSAAGLLVARQRELAGRLASATDRLRAGESARLAVVTIRERNRIARDLHDVVAHGVSVMVVQAAAARITADEEPDLARAALGEVTGVGRTALAELRRILGVIGADSGDDDGLVPPSGVSGIIALVERRRAGGLPVNITLAGTDSGPPERVFSVLIDAALYRVVQEALTNVVKHARSAATEVDVTVEFGAVRVQVTNAAPRGLADKAVTAHDGSVLAGSRQGLTGMRERVEDCGGRLWYGTVPGGGFTVRAEFPLPSAGPDAEAVPAGSARRAAALMRATASWTGVAAVLAAGCADAYASTDRTGPLALNLALVAGMSLALLWRRRAPLAFLIAVNLLALPLSDGLTSINNPTLVSTYVFAVPVWTVAAWSGRSAAMAGLVLTACFDAGEGLYWHLGWSSIVPNVLLTLVLWIAGRVLRAQRLMTADLQRTSTFLEAGQRAREALVLAEERTRMVAGLHTLVAEEVSAMIVAAESVRDLVGADTSAAASISEIERTGRHSLTKLREILGVLRSEYDPAPLLP